MSKTTFMFSLLFAVTVHADDLTPHWAVVSWLRGYPGVAEFQRTETECRETARLRNINAVHAGQYTRWTCEDLSRWGQQIGA